MAPDAALKIKCIRVADLQGAAQAAGLDEGRQRSRPPTARRADGGRGRRCRRRGRSARGGRARGADAPADARVGEPAEEALRGGSPRRRGRSRRGRSPPEETGDAEAPPAPAAPDPPDAREQRVHRPRARALAADAHDLDASMRGRRWRTSAAAAGAPAGRSHVRGGSRAPPDELGAWRSYAECEIEGDARTGERDDDAARRACFRRCLLACPSAHVAVALVHALHGRRGMTPRTRRASPLSKPPSSTRRTRWARDTRRRALCGWTTSRFYEPWTRNTCVPRWRRETGTASPRGEPGDAGARPRGRRAHRRRRRAVPRVRRVRVQAGPHAREGASLAEIKRGGQDANRAAGTEAAHERAQRRSIGRRGFAEAGANGRKDGATRAAQQQAASSSRRDAAGRSGARTRAGSVPTRRRAGRTRTRVEVEHPQLARASRSRTTRRSCP